MKYIILTMVLFLFVSCKNNDEEIGRPDPYILTERDISEDCGAFQMRFKHGDCILNFALSGPCEQLKTEEYINEYSEYLQKYQDSLLVKKGFILLQYHSHNFADTTIKNLQDSIINITKKSFKTNVSLKESGKGYFEINVGNDK